MLYLLEVSYIHTLYLKEKRKGDKQAWVPISKNWENKIVNIFLPIFKFKNLFWMFKRMVSIRRFFWLPTKYVLVLFVWFDSLHPTNNLQGTKIFQYCTCPAGQVTYNFHSPCKHMHSSLKIVCNKERGWGGQFDVFEVPLSLLKWYLPSQFHKLHPIHWQKSFKFTWQVVISFIVCVISILAAK